MADKGRLIEIYHFIDPLGYICYDSEKTIAEFAKERYEKVSVRFIPFINLRIIQNHLKRDRVKYSFQDANQYYTNAYTAALGFYAASMQGKKFGRTFLMNLQRAIFNDQCPVSLKTFEQIAQDSSIDVDMFKEDFNSKWVCQRFNSDQKLAQEMNILDTPSCIVYSSSDSGIGYLIENAINKDMLHSLCHQEGLAYGQHNPKYIRLVNEPFLE